MHGIAFAIEPELAEVQFASVAAMAAAREDGLDITDEIDGCLRRGWNRGQRSSEENSNQPHYFHACPPRAVLARCAHTGSGSDEPLQ